MLSSLLPQAPQIVASAWHFYKLEATLRNASECVGDKTCVHFQDDPVSIPDHDEANLPMQIVLLLYDALVSGDHHREAGGLCLSQKSPINQQVPAPATSEDNLVMNEVWCELVRHVLIKENFQTQTVAPFLRANSTIDFMSASSVP